MKASRFFMELVAQSCFVTLRPLISGKNRTVIPQGGTTVRYSFGSDGGDGLNPNAGPVSDSGGSLYGTTIGGGSSSIGTVFELAATPQDGVQIAIDQVNALYSQSVLNSGQDNSLVKELEHAIQMMNAGKIDGAVGNLKSFISEVQDLESSRVLTYDQATALINAANNVIVELT